MEICILLLETLFTSRSQFTCVECFINIQCQQLATCSESCLDIQYLDPIFYVDIYTAPVVVFTESTQLCHFGSVTNHQTFSAFSGRHYKNLNCFFHGTFMHFASCVLELSGSPLIGRNRDFLSSGCRSICPPNVVVYCLSVCLSCSSWKMLANEQLANEQLVNRLLTTC